MNDEVRPGRYFIFDDPKKLRRKIKQYFDECDPHVEEVTEWVEARDKSGKLKKDEYGLNYLVEIKHMVKTEQKPYSIVQLALHLGVSRDTLNNYRKVEHYPNNIDPFLRQEMIDTIEEAAQRVEAFNEQQLIVGNANGVKFNLTNNFGWVEKTVVDNNNRTVSDDLDEIDDVAVAEAERQDAAEEAQKELDKIKNEASNEGPEAQEQVVAPDAPIQDQG
jgi:hypothetical protein